MGDFLLELFYILVGLLMYIVIGKGLPMIAKGVISLFNRLKGGTATC